MKVETVDHDDIAMRDQVTGYDAVESPIVHVLDPKSVQRRHHRFLLDRVTERSSESSLRLVTGGWSEILARLD
jgi:hypothetical protein